VKIRLWEFEHCILPATFLIDENVYEYRFDIVSNLLYHFLLSVFLSMTIVNLFIREKYCYYM